MLNEGFLTMKNINSIPHALSYLSKPDAASKREMAKYWGLSVKLINRNRNKLKGKFYHLNYDSLITVLVENLFSMYRLSVYLSKVNSAYHSVRLHEYSEEEQDKLEKGLAEHRDAARGDMAYCLPTVLAVCMFLQVSLEGRNTRSLKQTPFTFKDYESLRCLAYKIINRSVEGKEILTYSSKAISERVVDKTVKGNNMKEPFLVPSLSTVVACCTGYWIGCGSNPVKLFKNSYYLIKNLIETPPENPDGVFIEHLSSYDFISALDLKKEGN